MNTSLCFYPECPNSPDFICFCSGDEITFCEAHLSQHISEGFNHDIREKFVDLSKGDRKILIAQCKLSIRKLKEIRDNINKKTKDYIQKIIEQAKHDFEYLRHKELLIMEVIEFLKMKKKIFYNKNHSECEQFIINYSKNPENICKKLQENEVDFIEDLDLGYNQSELKLKIEGLQDEISNLWGSFHNIINERYDIATQISKELENKFKSHKIDSLKNNDKLSDTLSYLGLNYEDGCIAEANDTKIWYFQYNTKSMITVNILAQKDSSYNFSLPENLSCNASYCKLGTTKFFYYSGYNENVYLDSTYIFDAQNKTYEKKASWILNQLAACSLYKQDVYVFGGCNHKLHGKSGKYSLISNTWKEIASLPSVSHHNLSLVFNNHIIISGYHLGSAIKYNIKENKYICSGSLTPNCYKIVCKGNGKVFIFENNKLHESTSNACTEFVLVKSSIGLPNQPIISYAIRNGDFIYFALIDMNLYRFNLNSKVVSMVRKINVV